MKNAVDHMFEQARKIKKEGAEGNALRGGRQLSISNCAGGGAHAKNFEVSISPEDPGKGQTYSMHTVYDLDETVTGGKAHYKGSLSGFPVVDETHDLCEDLSGGDTPCPLSGHIDSTSDGEVPGDVPSGKYEGQIRWEDQNGQEILCMSMTFHL